MKNSVLTLLFFLLTSWNIASADDFKIENGKFLLNGEPIQLICGEMHYPRVPQEYWRDRLLRAKAMGINTISTYVFWNIHERRPGEFDFSGEADLAKFIKTAQEVGLYVVLRPGPYVCAEWDFGGYPYWIQKEKGMVWRADNEPFLKACKRYIDRLGKELKHLTVTNGGPILLVQVENEYGSYAGDKVYLAKLRDMIKAAGFNVPLITCDGAGQMPNGYVEGCLPTVNGAVGNDIMRSIDRYQKGGPYFVAEFYPAWFDVWGKRHSYRAYQGPTKQLDWMLEHDVSISIYMFHGGTNFCFTNGANNSMGYEPQPTSYDYDAPLGEYGNPTPKYMAFREMIQRHLPEGKTLPDVPALNPIATFAPVQLTKAAPLSAVFGERIKNEQPLTMEDVNQDFGYLHYETTLKQPAKGALVVKDVRDFAVVLADGRPLGTLDRRLRQNKLNVDLKAGTKLEILVENVGRINYGPDLLKNLKGITKSVTLAGDTLKDWTMTPLPLYATLAGKGFKKAMKAMKPVAELNVPEGAPAIFGGTFELEKQGDVFLDMRGWTKGAVWVNGRSIGKYWYIGPHQTLYVPGPWLKEGRNEIIVLDLERGGHRSVAGLERPILDSVVADRNLPSSKRPVIEGRPILDEGDLIFSAQLKKEDGVQHFRLPATATMRHLCLQVAEGYDGENACLSELQLFDAEGKAVPRDEWSVIYASSEEPGEGEAEQLFDDDESSSWHSKWSTGRKPFPHNLIIDLGEIRTVSAVSFRQRSVNRPGTVKQVRLFGRPQFFLFK